MFIESLFIVYAISFSPVKTDSFPDKAIFSEPDPFSLKYGFIILLGFIIAPIFISAAFVEPI